MTFNKRHNFGTVEGSWAEYLWEHGKDQHRDAVGSVSGVGTTYFVHCFDVEGLDYHPTLIRERAASAPDLQTLVFIVLMASGPPPTRVVLGTAFTTMTEAFKWAADRADRELAAEMAL